VGTTVTSAFQVVNRGNAGATITLLSTGSPFSVAPAGAAVLGANSAASFTGAFAPVTSITLASGSFSIASASDLCAPLPSPLLVSGTGTNGVLAFAPGSLAFGNQGAIGLTACGTQAPPRQVTFTNSGNQDYVITPVLEGGTASPYALLMSPANGTVEANGGSLTLTVTPAPVPQESATPGSYNDTLRITTTVSGDATPHLISLSEGAYGAILGGAPGTLAFPNTPIAGESDVPIALTKSGNAPATVEWRTISNAVFSFDQDFTAAPGGVVTSPLAYFQPLLAQPYGGTAVLGVSASTILCQPILSPLVNLTGTGTSGAVAP
jgi:hypothetical protein